MGENKRGLEFIPGGLMPAVDALVDHYSSLDEAELAFDAIKAKRDEAIKKAGEPFDDELSERSRALQELKRFDSALELKNAIFEYASTLDEIDKTAFSISVDSHWGLDHMAEAILSHAGEDTISVFLSAGELTSLREFNEFSEFRKNVSECNNEPMPVAFISIDWNEYRDSQAEWEGYSGSTGEYCKLIQVCFGEITSDSFSVEATNGSGGKEGLLASLTPNQVRLTLENTRLIVSESDWGGWNAKTEVSEPPVSFPLFTIEPDDGFLGFGDEMPWSGYEFTGPDWLASKSCDTSVMRSGAYGRMIRDDKQTLLLYGDNLK